jgi:phenylpropionate dioxygenase-like ring-hydroxylating dioxygenase large terminal subunit
MLDMMDWNPIDFSEIPYAVYSDDAIYKRERSQIFRGATWNFIGLELELPAIGDYKTIFVGDIPVIVVRDQSGRINAMVNRCAHRGNLVCIQEKGNTERLTCVYHNWTFDLEGNLASIAFERGIQGKGGMAQDFDRECRGLERLRVETYCGLIFGTFSDELGSLSDYLGPEMRANIDRVLGRGIEILGRFRHGLDGNWKLYMENVRDTYHATLLHSFFPTFGLNRLSMKGGIELSEGGLHHLTYSIRDTDQAESQYNSRDLRAVKDGYALNAPELLEGWPEYECGTTLAIQSIFPNFSVQQVSNVITVRLIVPKGPDKSELTWWILGAANDTPEQRAIRLRQSNLIGPGGLIAMEDGAVVGWVRRGVAGSEDERSLIAMGGRETERFSDSRCNELSVRAFWQGWYGLMGN